ncbi:MAG: hypothetical protein QG637_1581, partial [Chloroflexota bacterium]|nr:hypothetical protein [Chloroflexota bacterium]
MSSRPRQWKFRIRHILEAIAENTSYVRNLSYRDFCADAKTLKAVAWNLVIIGEAARLIPPDIESAYPSIPWVQIRGMRNHIVHGYDQVDTEIVWNVIQIELPELVPIFE